MDSRVFRIYLGMMLGLSLAGSARAESFEQGWRFQLGDSATAMMPGFSDGDWRVVQIPHDWSVEGPFGPQYGSGNGYAPGGIGWYRKAFDLKAEQQGRRVVVMFDGVYHNSEVWVNGHLLGQRPSGYHSFYYDMTPYLHFGSQPNVLAVRVDHSRFADSRWYTGSGIYRHVQLIVTDKLHIEPWGVFVTTPEVTDGRAVVRIETTVKNDHETPRIVMLMSEILAPQARDNAMVGSPVSLEAGQSKTVVQTVSLPNPKRWSLESPTLYTVKSEIHTNTELVHREDVTFGIRTIRFDADQGFFLNEKPLKLKGVCLHHDAGSLGAAVPDKVLERRLRLMKSLGANAIRTSHNPSAPELLDICDRIGLLVKDEAFDEFTPPKNKWVAGWNKGQPSRFGYGEVFAEWSVRDMEDLVLRDRNHPCVIMWSIGNEIDYANDPFSHPVLGDKYRPTHPRAELLKVYAEPLVAAVKKLDTTRPVTAALANLPMSNAVGLAQCLDVVGYNYQEKHYEADHKAFPKRVIFGSENGDSYGAWQAVVNHDYIAGQFLWTGIDYLGEAGVWPNRAAGAGLLDLCGFKKPVGWYRQSLWSDTPMVYACVTDRIRGRQNSLRGRAHWNWQAGQTVSVQAVTNCDAMALELNGRLLERKSRDQAEQGVLSWQVPYEAGVLRAVGYQAGEAACEFVLKTTGAAHHIALIPDVTQLQASGSDICHLEFRVVDEAGQRVATETSEVRFEILGPAHIIGIGNGDLSDIKSNQDLVHNVFQGRGLAIVQSGFLPGKVQIRAECEGLEPANLELTVR
ncbi:MAG: DUF4982 domain-containing protein [Phycisphaeraceae bacterium]|nr:DUF4982 domain-containing protein [Phycisphaeraceae bacterium]